MAAKKIPEKTAPTAPMEQPAEEPPRPSAPPPDNLALLEEMEVAVVLELGRRRLTLDQALSLDEQSVVEIDKTAGQPIDVLVNGRLFARGEVVTVGEHFGVRLTQIAGQV